MGSADGAAKAVRMAENEQSEWVGCQWIMQGFCGRRPAPQRAPVEPRAPTPATEPIAAEPIATELAGAGPVNAGPAVAPAPKPAPRPRAARGNAWSAARKAAAAKRRRRPAA